MAPRRKSHLSGMNSNGAPTYGLYGSANPLKRASFQILCKSTRFIPPAQNQTPTKDPIPNGFFRHRWGVHWLSG